MKKAIIFDLDGTIIDTELMWADATKQMLLARGIEYNDTVRKDIHNKVHGLPPLKACAIVKNMFDLSETIQELAQEKSQRAHSLFVGNIRFIPGFTSFHQQLCKLNIKIAVATNCSLEFVSLADQELNLKFFFNEHLYSISHVENRSKPDPAVYLYAAQQIGMAPEECIAIEDSAAGIAAAKNAGMYCIGINTSGNRKNLENADIVCESYKEIELFLK